MLRKRGIQQLKRYCREPIENIRGYEEALNSKEKYDCHHINELTFSKPQLIKMNMYYNRPASELVLMTSSEHSKLHRKHNMPSARFGVTASMYGRRGENHPMHGKGYLQLGSKNHMFGRTMDKHPRWQEDPQNFGGWYRHGKMLYLSGKITEEEYKEYKRKGAEMARMKRRFE